MSDRLSRLQHVLRARRLRARARRLLREERLRDGADAAREKERALLGALIGEPRMIRVAARQRPPSWFTDAPCLLIMRALFCLASRPDLIDVEAVVEALDVHEALEPAGGRDAVVALTEERPALDAARAELAAMRARLVPVEDETIVLFARTLLGGEPEVEEGDPS